MGVWVPYGSHMVVVSYHMGQAGHVGATWSFIDHMAYFK